VAELLAQRAEGRGKADLLLIIELDSAKQQDATLFQ